MAISVGPFRSGVVVEMDPEEAHEMACYFYQLSARDNPKDSAKNDMLAIIRVAHTQDAESCDPTHDCPEPVAER